ncbi:exopolyphosphatase [Biscogniauxia mediterranea]|nr:exopolyphosphatase [Biscogniauxia mediterranea]
MPPSRAQTGLRAFLARARSVLTAPPSQRPAPLTFVIGNESADLDSLCSALLLAYFRTHHHGNSSNGVLHIPLCHLPRADLALRPEFSAVLADAGAAPDDVLTLDELPAPHLQPEDTRWFLVDHNVMTGTLGALYGDRVVGCIDHHVDEGGNVLRIDDDSKPVRIIEKSGSCASLVLEHCKDAWDALSTAVAAEGADEEGTGARIDAQLARLALGPILIDTVNLGDEHKTTAHDVRAVEIAESKIHGGDPYDRATFFANIAALKEDVSHMSFRDIFRKDYKEWIDEDTGLKLGTSAMPRSFAYIVREKTPVDGEGTFIEELGKWSAEKDIDIASVMDGFVDDGGVFHRELLVWARGSKKAVQAAKAFAEANAEKLQLRTWGDGKLDLDDETEGWRRCWEQGTVEHSRKQIAPMLRDVLSEKTAASN